MNLFVANLSPDVDDVLFHSTFVPFGQVLSAKVMLDIHTGLSRRFGFVLFENEEDGLRAMSELQGTPLGAKATPMVISKAQTTGYNAVQPTTKVHIRNVPRATSNDQLRKLLLKFGKLERLAVRGDANDAFAGTYGVFAQYSTTAEAQNAVKSIHNARPWPNMVVPLLAKPAETAEMRVQRKARQEARRQAGGPPDETTPPPHSVSPERSQPQQATGFPPSPQKTQSPLLPVNAPFAPPPPAGPVVFAQYPPQYSAGQYSQGFAPPPQYPQYVFVSAAPAQQPITSVAIPLVTGPMVQGVQGCEAIPQPQGNFEPFSYPFGVSWGSFSSSQTWNEIGLSASLTTKNLGSPQAKNSRPSSPLVPAVKPDEDGESLPLNYPFEE